MDFSNFKVANYPQALVSPEMFARHMSRLFKGEVIDGLTVAPGTGLKVILSPGNAFIRYGSAAVASTRLVSLVANFELSIGTPDASNPRIDLVVLYVDNSVVLPSGTPSNGNLDGPGVAKAKIVSGSPSANPSAPNATAIQASVGAGNPYTVLAEVRVDKAPISVIAVDKITDVRAMAKLMADKIDWATAPTPVVGISSVTLPPGKWLIIATGSVYSATKGVHTISIAGKSITVQIANDSTVPVAITNIVTPTSATVYSESRAGLSGGFNSVVAVPVFN